MADLKLINLRGKDVYVASSILTTVFPSAYRAPDIDPNARLNTEQSLTSLTSTDKNAIINYVDSNDTLDIDTIMINGYSFTFSNGIITPSNFKNSESQPITNKNIYAFINIRNVPFLDSEERSYNTKILKNIYITNSENYIINNQLDNTIDGENYFTGLIFATENLLDNSDLADIISNGICLFIYDTNTNKYKLNYTMVPAKIQSGEYSSGIVLNNIYNTTKTDTANIASGENSIAGGLSTEAVGNCAVATGWNTKAVGDYSHVEGIDSQANGTSSHAEGKHTIAHETAAHTEGGDTNAYGAYSHAEGYTTTASSDYSHAEGYYTEANGEASHAEGGNTTTDINAIWSHAEGHLTEAFGQASHAEGDNTTASGQESHAEGKLTKAVGEAAHAEGISDGTINNTFGDGAHSEGYKTQASANYAHAEGSETDATGMAAHAEGENTTAYGKSSHTEGYKTATGNSEDSTKGAYAHAEGNNTRAVGEASHAEGFETTASGKAAHASGFGTIASNDYQTVVGKFNKEENGEFIVGIGTDVDNRKNALVVNGLTTTIKKNLVINNDETGTSNKNIFKVTPTQTDILTETNNITGKTNTIIGDTNTIKVGEDTKVSIKNTETNIDNTAINIIGTGIVNINSKATEEDENEEEHIITQIVTTPTNTVCGFGKHNITADKDHVSITDAIIENDVVINNKKLYLGNAKTTNNDKASISYNDKNGTHELIQAFGKDAINSPCGAIIGSDGVTAIISGIASGIQEYVAGNHSKQLDIVSDTKVVITTNTQGSGEGEGWNGTNIKKWYFHNTGELVCPDKVTAPSFYATSDKRLKENLSLYKAEKSILELPVYKYDFINGDKGQIGCLAQDLQAICPEIVKENADGYLSIQESKIVYLLLEEVKKLRKEIEEIKNDR